MLFISHSKYYSGIKAHRLCSTCGPDLSMTLGDKEYITYRKQRYKSRERKLEATIKDAEEEAPMEEEIDDEEFENLLLKSA